MTDLSKLVKPLVWEQMRSFGLETFDYLFQCRRHADDQSEAAHIEARRTARIIAVLDADAVTKIREAALREAASVIERHRDYGMVGSDGQFLGDEAEVIAHGHAMHYAMQDILALIDKEGA